MLPKGKQPPELINEQWNQDTFIDCTVDPLIVNRVIGIIIKSMTTSSSSVYLLLPHIKHNEWIDRIRQHARHKDLGPIGTLAVIQQSSARTILKSPDLISITSLDAGIDLRTIESVEERNTLMQNHHALGHFGAFALVKSIMAERVSWKSISKDCANFVASCQDCQKYTIKKTGFHPLQPILARLPWDHVSFDLFQMRTSSDGFNFVLIIVDICTRMVFLRPLKVKSMYAVAHELFKLFIDIGFPRILQSDNGSEFVNRVMKAMIRECAMQHRTITPYHPRANGVSERFVRTAKDALLKELRGAETQWVEKVPHVQLAMNLKVAALHASSPFSLFFGRKFNFFGNYSNSVDDPASIKELEQRLDMLTKIVYPSIADKAEGLQEARAIRFNQNNMISEFPIGSYVMTVTSVKEGKGSARYEGPYKVVSRTSKGAYQLLDHDGVLLNRKYSTSQIRPVSTTHNEQEPSFEVERIIKHKQEEGIKFYWVKWKGYDSNSNSWVAEKDFDDLEMIRDYWKELTPKAKR
jgi:transposase InsO family protein